MSTHFTPTESLTLSTTTTTESLLQKSWHVLGLLLFCGGPTPPADLASLCTLFHASPAAIQSLCSIPNSPIALTRDGLITVSHLGLLACGNFLSNFDVLFDARLPRSLSPWIGSADLSPEKREQIVEDGIEEEQYIVNLPKRRRGNDPDKVCYYMSNDIVSSWASPLLLEAGAEQLTCELNNAEQVQRELSLDLQLDLVCREDNDASCCPKEVENNCVRSPEELANCDDVFKNTSTRIIENEEIISDSECERSFDLNMPSADDVERIDEVDCNDTCVEVEPNFPAAEISVAPHRLPKSSAKISCRDVLAPELPSTRKSLRNMNTANTPEEKQLSKDQTLVIRKQKLKQTNNQKHQKESKINSNSVCAGDQSKPKTWPNFKAYTIEEEEGSGGYGTVYRARRNIDDFKVAIKYPHENAHRQHVNTELRMLERFGGKNHVIKYEGCFKHANTDCFVLEHVEHDRPEVLKREIDICQLRWYSYCMFQALASLHKHGILHRDVKPGNFLFSRKTNMGYLIDFNLATDLNQKYGTSAKSKRGYDIAFSNVTVLHHKLVPPIVARKFTSAKSNTVNGGSTKGPKPALEPKNMKKNSVGQTKAFNDLGNWNKINSQGAEGSGITSAKEVTSTRTPSAEGPREPMPCKGRKELINLAQKAMHKSNPEILHVPAPMRKRVAATPGKADRGHLYLTPMPLHSKGIAVAGAGLIKNKGDGKLKREGPCAGTKGFRAPEVLFRSPHQGPKADVWSAGVTLLYLMIGRSPFTGDPKQNIKEIAKLKGSEDLWEVAKLHDRESSFPKEFYDTQFLPPLNLREWCRANSKRRDFLDIIPSSLFDLVDKCLTSNPRLRISAEEALKHEFLVPCHENLKKQKLLRQRRSLESASSSLSRQ